VIGSDATAGTIKFYEARLAELDAVPHKLSDTKNNRLAKAREIHAVIRQLADTYRELYEPVHQFIQQRPLAREKFQLNCTHDTWNLRQLMRLASIFVRNHDCVLIRVDDLYPIRSPTGSLRDDVSDAVGRTRR